MTARERAIERLTQAGMDREEATRIISDLIDELLAEIEAQMNDNRR